MKSMLLASRLLVGILFIFSGLVKANDPLGLSYKMQEFFELWHLTSLNDFTLPISILMISLEIIAGVAVLLGWKMRFWSWLLLLLILFFTFLTGYAYLSGKFKNCGCFGDCIPITPLTSFIKDLVLLALIGFLFIYRGQVRPVLSNRSNWIIMILVTLGSFGLQWYVLKHLPIVDCLPYKVNNDISEKMKIPAGAVPDSFAIRFIYEKGGKQFEFDMNELPADLETYTYVDRKDRLVRKGNAEPPIKGFSLAGITGADSTAVVLSQPVSLLLFAETFPDHKPEWAEEFSAIYQDARRKNIPVYLVTTSIEPAWNSISGTGFSDIQVFTCDFTAIRTAARSNPTLYLLNNGRIEAKWSRADMEEARGKIINP